MTDHDYDVVVGGAGIVGATLALALARLAAKKPLRVALVEPTEPESGVVELGEAEPSVIQAEQAAGDSGNDLDIRVVALNESSRQLLDALGVWEEVLSTRACPYTRMEIRDSEGTGCIEFNSADIQQDNLGHIVENALLQDALLKAIARQSNIDLLCPDQIKSVSRTNRELGFDSSVESNHSAQIGAECLSLTLENKAITSSLLIVADGARSKLRQICNFRTREWDYGHHGIVATLRGEKSHQHTAWQWFTPAGPLAFLPLQSQSGDTHTFSIVWSQLDSRSGSLMAMSEEAFCHELGLVSEHAMGELKLISPRQSFPLRQCHAIEYVQPRIALIGDAAHSIHPLAGQGVNLGLSDVRVFTEELTRSLHHDLDPGSEAVLKRYQRRRKPENLAVMAAMEGFKRLFERDELPLRVLRNMGMGQLNALTPVKNRLIKQAMGLG